MVAKRNVHYPCLKIGIKAKQSDLPADGNNHYPCLKIGIKAKLNQLLDRLFDIIPALKLESRQSRTH